MKKNIVIICLFIFLVSCGSGKSFKSFFNNHKNDLGATAFQVPNFMMSLVKNISPEINDVFGNVQDFKFITFDKISATKKAQLINDINLVTGNNFTDILRSNTVEKTKIVSVKEVGDVVTQAIIFNSTIKNTSVFYLKGRFDPNKIKELSETNQFENLSSKLIKNYNTPKFNQN
ncbi:DUF4252 domain-containing protein [Polaribacter batillariae]|uniref:DUF4252 domain-containing protein n=1 Tax=Polaribacter batillariae TaxID=2808900 RepID=A0ABX7SV26_9FLAO|nr:DUF4252 domain-containing protein [Polaribacter batillariae]QTD37188.1 DUF4252 domain-containing protein [Polaribacter batillariae]